MAASFLARIQAVEEALVAQMQKESDALSIGGSLRREEVLQWLGDALAKQLPGNAEDAKELVSTRLEEAQEELKYRRILPSSASFEIKKLIALKTWRSRSRRANFGKASDLFATFQNKVHADAKVYKNFHGVTWWHGKHEECLPYLKDAISRTCGSHRWTDACNLLQLRALSRQGKVEKAAVGVIMQMLHGPDVCLDCILAKWKNHLSGNAFFQRRCRGSKVASCPAYSILSGGRMQAVEEECRTVCAAMIPLSEEESTGKYTISRALTGSKLFLAREETSLTDIRFQAAHKLQAPLQCIRLCVADDYPLTEKESAFASAGLETGSKDIGVHATVGSKSDDAQMWQSFLPAIRGRLSAQWVDDFCEIVKNFIQPLLGFAEHEIVGSVAKQTCLAGVHDCDIVLKWEDAVPDDVFERLESCCDLLGLRVQPPSKHGIRKAVTVFFQGIPVDLIPGNPANKNEVAAWALASCRNFRLLEKASEAPIGAPIPGIPRLPMGEVAKVILLLKLLRADWLRHFLEESQHNLSETSIEDLGTIGLGSCHIENVTLHCAWRLVSEEATCGVPHLLAAVLEFLGDLDLDEKKVLQHPRASSRLTPSAEELAASDSPLYMCAPWNPTQNLLNAEPAVWKFAKESAMRAIRSFTGDLSFANFLQILVSQGVARAVAAFLDHHNRHPLLLENPWKISYGEGAIVSWEIRRAAETFYGGRAEARQAAVQQVCAGLVNPLLPEGGTWCPQIRRNFRPQDFCSRHAKHFSRLYYDGLRSLMELD